MHERARERLGPGCFAIAGRGIAGRKHDPIGIELEQCCLRRGEQAVVFLAQLGPASVGLLLPGRLGSPQKSGNSTQTCIRLLIQSVAV